MTFENVVDAESVNELEEGSSQRQTVVLELGFGFQLDLRYLKS